MGGLLVFLGGGLGAMVRYFLYLILPKNCAFPLGTLCANFFGCFIATIVFAYFIIKGDLHPHYKIFLITGFCGGLSTLSALSLEVLCFIQNGSYTKACFYIIISLIVCTISVLLGILVVKSNL